MVFSILRATILHSLIFFFLNSQPFHMRLNLFHSKASSYLMEGSNDLICGHRNQSAGLSGFHVHVKPIWTSKKEGGGTCELGLFIRTKL